MVNEVYLKVTLLLLMPRDPFHRIVAQPGIGLSRTPARQTWLILPDAGQTLPHGGLTDLLQLLQQSSRNYQPADGLLDAGFSHVYIEFSP